MSPTREMILKNFPGITDGAEGLDALSDLLSMLQYCGIRNGDVVDVLEMVGVVWQSAAKVGYVRGYDDGAYQTYKESVESTVRAEYVEVEVTYNGEKV